MLARFANEEKLIEVEPDTVERMNMNAKKVIIVPHTHWDREWYLPFRRVRYMLV